MIDLQRFIADVTDCLGIPYVSPGGTGVDCARSGIDCSGLLVRAYRLQGKSLYHGSNYIARHEVVGSPERLTGVDQLQPGMAVFKWRSTGEPARYKSDGMGDFHHIGVVTGVSPLTITHASSAKGKVVQDTSIRAWTHCARLSAVGYPPEMKIGENMEKYTVTAAGGGTVNLRRSADVKAEVLARVPVGAGVEGVAVSALWARVVWQDMEGWMMRTFLQPAAEATAAWEERLRSL